VRYSVRDFLSWSTSSVLKMVLRKGLRLISVGIALGVLASIALTRLVASQFWGMSPRDSVTFRVILKYWPHWERRRAWFQRAGRRVWIH